MRFGDHQPGFAKYAVDPALDDAAIGRRIDAADPRFFTTYYAIDALNFQPADLSSAINGLDAAYLPLVILEAAGVPLDASFAEQKRIFQRCNGAVLSLRQRRRGAPLQPAADRCRHDQAALTMSLAYLGSDRDDRPSRGLAQDRAGLDRRHPPCRARHHGLDGIRLVRAAVAVMLAWASLNFVFLALLRRPGDFGCAVAWSGRGSWLCCRSSSSPFSGW